jgi:hypothetical protein
MDGKPKGIWKKPWKGPRGLLRWFILLLAAAFLVIFSIGYASSIVNPMGELVFFAFLYAICWALAGVLLVAFIRWLRCWRNFKRFLFGLACLATLIALFYAEEDWRGKHDWEKFKREWEAKGEKFDYASIIPAPVPDDQNFALTPIVFTSYGNLLTRDGKGIPYKDRDTNFIDRLKISIYRENPDDGGITNVQTGDWRKAQLADLEKCQVYYRAPIRIKVLTGKTVITNEFSTALQPQSPAEDVLLALSKYDSAIEELRQASRLPYSRFPLNYDTDFPGDVLLPHLAALKSCSLVLQLRAIAELQNGQSEKALDDIKLMLRLTDSIHTEPFLISHLVRIAILQITLQPIYEGLAEHKWSDVKLAELDSELAKFDFLSDYDVAIRGERGLDVGMIEFLRHSHNKFHVFADLTGESSGGSKIDWATVALSIGPSGWFDQNELHFCQFYSKWYLPLANDQEKTVSPAAVRAADNALEPEVRHLTPENLLEVWLLPALGNAVKKFAYAQSSTDLARTAIALERYRLAHDEFPESPDTLAPQFLEKIPHDIIGGQPLHYRRTDDGQFILYSVGWNETDDGGVVETKVVGVTDRKSRTPIWDISQGDWVWRYPSKN